MEGVNSPRSALDTVVIPFTRSIGDSQAIRAGPGGNCLRAPARRCMRGIQEGAPRAARKQNFEFDNRWRH